MKVLNLLLLLFLLAGSAAAQAISNPSGAPGVAVIKQSWRRIERNPALDEDPMRINQEEMDIQRAQRATQRENAIRASRGQDPLPLPRGTPSRRSISKPLWVEYVYEARFMNTGTLKIRKLVWEYVFFEAGTKQEVGRRLIESKVNISPGKTGSVTVRSASPPASTVNVEQTGKKLREQYSEQVVIQSIEYDDGSVWQRPAN
ncbi:MAG TPA: hypothetical protein VGC66_04310 [Pyrinomonadaceae bacterium]|jgi:hypothetical protein